jgi:murein DD-endopeptidase MepM/ murein hydrolase activator NlpD
MPIGTTIVASRAGRVVAVQEAFVDGNGEDLKENFVFIRHEDGTTSRYYHLMHDGALVSMGDVVRQGQPIALSGNTADSAGPHLHFDVQACGPNLPPRCNALPCGQTVPVTFRNTRPHAWGLVAGEGYQARD